MWICGQKGVFLLHVFFLLCTLHNFDKKVWTGGPVMKIMKKSYNLFYFHFLKVWTFVNETVFLFHIFFLSFLYPSFFCKKVWTGGQVRKILKKSINLLYLIAWQFSAAKPKPTFGVEPQGQKTGSVGLGWPSGSKFGLDWVGLRFFHNFWVEPASNRQPKTFLFLCIP